MPKRKEEREMRGKIIVLKRNIFQKTKEKDDFLK